jgi:hypothetical protein
MVGTHASYCQQHSHLCKLPAAPQHIVEQEQQVVCVSQVGCLCVDAKLQGQLQQTHEDLLLRLGPLLLLLLPPGLLRAGVCLVSLLLQLRVLRVVQATRKRGERDTHIGTVSWDPASVYSHHT